MGCCQLRAFVGLGTLARLAARSPVLAACPSRRAHRRRVSFMPEGLRAITIHITITSLSGQV